MHHGAGRGGECPYQTGDFKSARRWQRCVALVFYMGSFVFCMGATSGFDSAPAADHSRHESFVFFVCTDLSPHTREKKKLSRNCAEFEVRALISVTNDLPAPPRPSHVFYVEIARCQTRRQPEKHGPDAHLRRHRRPREVYGVVCRVGRSGAAADARQCVIWSLILGVWRPAARATIHQV